MEELTPFEYAMLRYLQEAANEKDDEEIVRITKEHSKKLIDFRPK